MRMNTPDLAWRSGAGVEPTEPWATRPHWFRRPAWVSAQTLISPKFWSSMVVCAIGIAIVGASFRREDARAPSRCLLRTQRGPWGHPVVLSYDPTIYEGAAAHYRRGRPAYSPQLEAVLAEELDLDGRGWLLDAGCGPGILTVRLAHLFEEAVGLDPDPAMLAEGRRVARRPGHHEHPLGQSSRRGSSRSGAGTVPSWLPSASPSTGRTKPVWPKRCTTCWSQAAPWP